LAPARRPVLATRLQSSVAEAESTKGASDADKFFDRWNTRGGSIVATIVATVGAFALEKAFEAGGLEPLVAGQAVTAVYSVVLIIWTGQYFFRVATKSTTYAEQLKEYEEQVMMKRLEELDDDEIDALCAEVGISEEEISDTVASKDEKLRKLSQKEKVMEIFKIQSIASEDPRARL